jgi:hypothetical protein
MQLDQLAQLGEFIGGMFVVLSLVYLAYQVRQNTRSMRADNYSRVLDRLSTLQSRTAGDRELSYILSVGAEDPGRLTRGERVRFAWALYEMFGAAEFVFHQHREGTLPAAVWPRWDATICWWLSHPGMRAWWTSKPAPMTAEFEAFGNDIVRDDRFDAQAVARWRAFVAGTGLPKAGGPAASPQNTGG